MNCPACRHDNRPGAKFCEECAAPLKHLCAACGSELRPTAKFCDECGAATQAAGKPSAPPPPASTGARKVVTIVFGDLVGSTALHERLDPESVRQFMERYYAAMRVAVEAHGGTVTQLLGDGVKAVFGAPRVAEDDAIRAVRAAVAMQDAFRELAAQQSGRVGKTGLRVAVNTGEVVADEATEIIGDPVNVAARLQEQGRDGDVVIGGSTQRLVSALVTLELLGTFALKGRAEAVKACRVISLDRPAGATTAAFVGRDEELARLGAVYDAAIAKPAARLAVVLGSPGQGKSRLIDELTRRLGDAAAVVTAQCDAAGGATFAPLAKALREHFQVDAADDGNDRRTALAAALPDDGDRARIVSGIAALLAGSPASPEETFFVVRRLLAALAAAKPVVLVIDDLHWAEPLLLDLVEHLVQWGSGVPLLVLAGARPELRNARSSLATPGGFVADVVTLGGLDAGAAMRLAAGVIGASDLPAAVAAKLLATSEGNPLFVGELMRMLMQEGVLERQGERWTVGAGLAALEMPPTIYALLAARIERLRPEERNVMERAAVIGRHFSRAAVAALLPGDATELDARFEALLRSELIERDTGWFLGEPVLRFHHVLIRDAAYRRVLKGTRAELHARFADWVEARAGDAVEHDETIGWHLEQAHQHLRELGPLDAAGAALGERAARRLAAAGRRALARDDVPLAASLLGRAIDRLVADAPERADLALDWCEALLSAGDVGAAGAAIEELGRLAADSDRLRAWHTCFAGQLTVLTAPEALQATAERVGAAARELGALGDAAGEAKAYFVHAQALARLGRVGACEAALDQALAAARRAGDRRRANAVLAGAPLAALWGPSPVTRASGRCLDVVRVLRITQGAPAVEAVALSCQGVLEALRGRTDAARRMIASSRKMVEELGITHRLFEADAFAGRIDLLEGDAAAAERSLRGAYEGLRDLGLGIDAARAAALLARALLAQDRAAEAEALSYESEALAGDDLQAAIAWRGVRAEALARRGEHAEAIALAQAAVAIAAATDALLDHADARLALAAALRAAGRSAEADAEERRAIELWQAKGATLLAGRARKEGADVAQLPAESEPRVARVPAARRDVRSNAATAWQARFDAALAARDFDAAHALTSEDYQEIDHPTGSCYGTAEALGSLQRLFRSLDPVYREEPFAALGDALCLRRRLVRASGAAGRRYDVGAYENEAISLVEIDERGLACRQEVFAVDQLGSAVKRLYERYAERLPDGPARARAAATARSVAALLGPFDLARFATGVAPDIVVNDHRRVGLELSRGAEAWLSGLRALLELAGDLTTRIDDVLALETDTLLVRWMNAGIDRVGGGPYERHFLWLAVFGPDGLVTQLELFEPDRGAEALARLDGLARGVESAATAPRRRVHPNAASTLAARFQDAFAAGDDDVLGDLFASSLEVVDHPNGANYGRDGHLASVRRLRRAQEPALRFEPLATLGEGLSLSRRRITASGTGGDRFDVGAYEREEIVLFEAYERRCQHIEVFATNHLGAAIARLYERHADSLSEGPERQRAAATARSVAAMTGFLDHDRVTTAVAPAIEVVDHRILGTWSAHGADALLRHIDAWLAVGQACGAREEDIRALQSDALLMRRTFFGTDREGGGAFDGELIVLWAFGSDGRLARWEMFDVDREAAALARFDALVGGDGAARFETLTAPVVSSLRFANAATRSIDWNADRFTARDWAGIEGIVDPAFEFDDRRRLVRLQSGAADFLAGHRVLFDVPGGRWRLELLATRGERLSLHRVGFEGRVAGGGGPLAYDEHLCLAQVGADGRFIAVVLFDLHDLDAAYAELDARYDAGEGATLAGVLSNFVREFVNRDWAALAARCAPTLVEYDHRPITGLGTTRGPDAWVHNIRVWIDLAPDTLFRWVHVRRCDRGILWQLSLEGSRDGGRYELPFVGVAGLDEQRRFERIDVYEPDQLAQALARFEELKAAPPPTFANAATATIDPVIASMVAHDWRGFTQLLSEDFQCSDRRRLVQLELDRDGYMAFTREVADERTIRGASEVLATRGDRLALLRSTFEFTDADVGPSEIAFLIVTEVDDRGRIVAYVRFDLEDLDAAYAELDARWATGEAAIHPLASRFLADFGRSFAARDWNAMGGIMAPDLISQNHRLVSWGTLHGPAGLVSTLQAQMELAPDTQARFDHVRTCEGGLLLEYAGHGTREGGVFENLIIGVVELDALGRARRIDVWEPGQLERARARFDEIVAAPPRQRFANATTRAWDEQVGRWRARDWRGFADALPAAFRYSDRRAMVQLELDRDQCVDFSRQLGDMASARVESELVATRGERLALARNRFEGADGDVGPSQVENLDVIELDERGAFTALVRFDATDLDAAYAELDARWEAGEGAEHAAALAAQRRFTPALDRRDWDAVAALYSPAFVGHDHRLVSWGTLRGPAAFVEAFRAMVELAPNARVRWHHVRTSSRGLIADDTWVGTRDGGAFESPFVVVLELDGDGRVLRCDFYDPHHLEQALARFHEIGSSTVHDPFAATARPHAAIETLERWQAAFDAGSKTDDWEAMRGLCAPGMIFEDRRRLALLSGDGELMIASARERARTGARPEGRLVGTAGDRVVIGRMLWSGGPPDGRFEIEYLSVLEVDEAGRFTAMIFFDLDDARAAQREAWARWAAIDPVAGAAVRARDGRDGGARRRGLRSSPGSAAHPAERGDGLDRPLVRGRRGA